MLRLNSNNQIVLLYFYDNKKQTTIVLYSCHLNATVNHLRSTLTYTSYIILLFFVTKYYKSAVYVGGDSDKSDQTYVPKRSTPHSKNIPTPPRSYLPLCFNLAKYLFLSVRIYLKCLLEQKSCRTLQLDTNTFISLLQF